MAQLKFSIIFILVVGASMCNTCFYVLSDEVSVFVTLKDTIREERVEVLSKVQIFKIIWDMQLWDFDFPP